MTPAKYQYRVRLENRYIASDTLYANVDWSSLDQVIEAFDRRVMEWYIKPANALSEQRHDFALMAMLCVLIDTLSQFESGELESSRRTFKNFTRRNIDGARNKVDPPIPHNRIAKIEDFADALYHAFRCGILHEAHVEAYGLVRRDHESPARIFRTEPDLTDWSSGNNPWTPMLSVLIDPEALRLKILDVYRAYIARVKNPAEAILRRNFVTKFEASFGVEITDKSVKG